MEVRSRGWCITCNNPLKEDIELVEGLPADYVIYEFETGDNGTLHLQGYLYFKSQKSFKKIGKLLSKKFHYEAQKGTKIEALVYCMKDGTYWEKGVRPQQGKRGDLDAIHMDLKWNRKSIKQVADQYFSRWCQYNRSFDKYVEMNKDYDTILVQYSTDHLAEMYMWVYKNYKNVYIQNPALDFRFDVFEKFYSRKYQYVVIPDEPIYSKFLEQHEPLLLDYFEGETGDVYGPWVCQSCLDKDII